ncbi:MAG: lactate dehydrogenase [Armatimonadota bacterium]|nr:MAG: lactate dehydrogenase [Armatimonadota bacterium]
MNVTIVGGAGKVGAAAAFALQVDGVVRRLAVIDVMKDAAAGEALDLRHGSPLCGPLDVCAGGYEVAEGSDVVVITAGLRRKPDESRLQLINRNVSLFRDILTQLADVSMGDGVILLVVANPVDVLTRIALDAGWPAERTIGTGTFLDTVRFRSLLAQRLDCDPRAVDALILGEHGDTMVPMWSLASIGGMSLTAYAGCDEAMRRDVFQAVKGAGAEMIRLKSGAAYAIGLCVRDVVRAIARDERRPLPLSTLQRGACGIDGVCLSLPTVIGRNGVCSVLEPAAAQDELDGLRASAAVLRETMAAIERSDEGE